MVRLSWQAQDTMLVNNKRNKEFENKFPFPPMSTAEVCCALQMKFIAVVIDLFG